MKIVVGPGYYLVCYNPSDIRNHSSIVVGPGYYLVCYNSSGITYDFFML